MHLPLFFFFIVKLLPHRLHFLLGLLGLLPGLLQQEGEVDWVLMVEKGGGKASDDGLFEVGKPFLQIVLGVVFDSSDFAL